MAHKFDSPDQYWGHISWQMAQSDEYMMGPLAQLNRQKKDKLEVAARLINDRIEYNFEILSGMPISDAITQIKGLVTHQALLHMERKRVLTGGLQEFEEASDLAAELATWHMLGHERREVSDKFPKPGHFGFPEHLSMEEYFKLIIDQAKKKGFDPGQFGEGTTEGQGQSGSGDGDGDEEQDQQQKKPSGGKGQDQQTPTNQLAKALGSKQAKDYHKQDYSQWHTISKIQQEAAQAELPDKLENWMKTRGTIPAGLQRLLEELRKGVKEKWYQKIRSLVGTRMTTPKFRYSMKRPNRRLGFPFPGRMKVRKGLLAVAIDTSGSISPTELTIFIEKLHGVAAAYEAPFEVIICDADVHTVKKICKKRDIASLEIKGGGGTSSLPVFEYLEGKKPDMLVYLTDLYIDFPDNPPKYRVIWGVINRDDEPEAPFGETHQLLVEDGDIESPRRRRQR